MTDRNQPRKFIVAWLVAGIFGVPIAFFLSALSSGAALSILGSIAWPKLDFEYRHYDLYFNANLVLIGMQLGAFVGFMQQKITHRYLHFRLSRWTSMSMLGGAVAGLSGLLVIQKDGPILKLISAMVPQVTFFFVLHYAVTLLIVLLALSSFQALALRRCLRSAWRWVAAHALAVVFTLLLVSALLMLSPPTFLGERVFLLSISPVTAGGTGIAIVRMLQPVLRSGKAKRREDISESQVEATAPSPSVWDDAV